MRLLSNQCAIVTGAAQGIGAAIALLLCEQGASVVVADLDGALAEKTAAKLRERGGDAFAVPVDVREPAQASEVIQRCADGFGTVDILVNNAGVTRDATLRNMSLADWKTVLDVHLTGTYLSTQAAAKVMREQRSGAIVNISSISGKVGMVGQTNYSAAKAGLVGFTKAAAKELAPHGIRVNAIQPGLIRTRMTEALRQDIWEQKMAEIPMGRPGEAEEVAKVVLFLTSDLSSYVTGAVLEVTGGRHM